MKFAAFVSGCVLVLGLVPSLCAQQLVSSRPRPQSSPWWASFEAGAGPVTLTSDQQKGGAKTLRHRLFVRGGFGLSMYTNNHPDGVYGSGPGWEAGGGYEIPIKGQLRLAPMVEYASGQLGNGSPKLPQQTGLRYSVVEFKLSIVGNFGHRR